MSFTYDFAVIGAGSGGMAAAKEAARLGAKTVLFDFVKPSPQGTTWGVGGTCVNVGCVPKKLFHYSGLMGPTYHGEGEKFGWDSTKPKSFNWPKLVETVQNHIKSLNFAYRGGLNTATLTYINATASFKGPNELTYTENGAVKSVTAKNILIAVGGRPNLPTATEVPGALELAITSDDIFSYRRDKQDGPGKTLVVGASYIALECAGFLCELGYDVTVAVRSIFLRGFDQQCADKVGDLMRVTGTKFMRGPLPTKMEKTNAGGVMVTFTNGHKEEFSTVLYATGRHADIDGLNINSAGVSTHKGKIKTDSKDTTNVPHIYAVGDVVFGRPELTPTAIRAGELLSGRLFNKSTILMEWEYIPTTVFTPYEYGCVGMTEDNAIESFGKDNIDTYLWEFQPLELAAAHRQRHSSTVTEEWDADMPPVCLCKLVVNKNDNERVVGFHYVGPNAGETTQGFALSLKLGAKKSDFDWVVGIHPTNAEAFTTMQVKGSSGQSFTAAGGCGGGKCG
eukprot:GHVR01054275.1.p1 GENE.GHVR01054275.1~~GHVR01054275.1.p1  ORF type:complete len:508 (+),score=123.24 GHVR01054275.1:27-1550(+)